MDRRLKITLTVLVIILLSIISFIGLFVQDTKFMKDLIPEYKLGMDLKGYRELSLAVSDEKETVYYDKDGKEVEKKTEDGTTKEIPVNSEEILTKENFDKTKQLIDKRLSELNISEYFIRLNEKDGSFIVQIPEDNMTDIASQFLYSQGKFTIEDEDGQVLLSNSDLKKVQVGYSNETTGTTVHLSFVFNEESIEKVKEISNTYVTSSDEEGNDTSKKISMNIDGSPLIETSFEEEISNGTIYLTLGSAQDNETINSYLEQATNIAILINNGPIPITYTVEGNRFIKSDIDLENNLNLIIAIGIIFVLASIVLIIRYKKLGLLAALSNIGYLAILLLIVRYTNLIMTLEGICGIILVALLNYIIIVNLLENLKKQNKSINEYKKAFNKSMLSMVLVLIPTIIIGIVLSFSTWLPAYSFGTIIFWGVLIISLYNAFVTRIMIINSVKE